MSKRRWIAVAAVLTLLLFSQAAWSQTQGSVRGRAVDAEGNALPGVTIGISS